MSIINSIFKTYRGLPKQIYILFMINVINALGAFVGPFMTLYLSDILKLSNKTTAVFVTASFCSALLGALIGGKLTDIFGSKKIMIIFQCLTVLCYITCIFISRSTIVSYFLILSRFFNSVVQPAVAALMANLTNTSNRKNAYSLLYLGTNIGFSIGPMIAGYLFEHYTNMIFVGNAIAVFISMIIVLFFIKNISKDKILEYKKFNDEESEKSGSLLKVLLKRPMLIAFCVLLLLYSFIYSQINYCIPLYAKSLFDNSSVIFGNIMVINGISVISLTTIIVAFTKKYSSIFNLSLSGIFYAIGFGMLYFVKIPIWFYFSTLIWTIGEVLNSTNSGVYVANHSPYSHRGRVLSLVPFLHSAGFALGPFLMNIFIDNSGVKNAWLLIFILSIAASFLTFLLSKAENILIAKSI